MSGGSWDYMYSWDQLTFLERREDVARMAKRLTEKGHVDAARALEEFYCVLQHAAIQIDARKTALRDVFHAVEWHDSGDYSEEDLAEAVKRWAQPQRSPR